MSIVLAFSGGLDTSFCVPYLKETYGRSVITVTVNTGGIGPEDEQQLQERSRELGAERHVTVDGRSRLFDSVLSFLIKGNVRRGGVYPLCVGPERVTQAELLVEAARELGATTIAHGSTGAGNDQVRFDVALRHLASDFEILAPIRSLGLTREASSAYLVERGFDVPSKTTDYSINSGLWGTTIGGKESHDPAMMLPSEAYTLTVDPEHAPDEPATLEIGFEKGIPSTLDGRALDPVSLVEYLNDFAGGHGVGRDIHVGDTILGIKGRIGFEAPAAEVLLTAHREIEKLVLTRWQLFQKNHLADFYGMLLHEGQYFDPVMRDIEAFLDSTQDVVTGSVKVRLFKGSAQVVGCSSPYSMFNAHVATYGEENSMWDGRDAEGFSRIYGLQGTLAGRARHPHSATQNSESA